MHRTAFHNKELSGPKIQYCWDWESFSCGPWKAGTGVGTRALGQDICTRGIWASILGLAQGTSQTLYLETWPLWQRIRNNERKKKWMKFTRFPFLRQHLDFSPLWIIVSVKSKGYCRKSSCLKDRKQGRIQSVDMWICHCLWDHPIAKVLHLGHLWGLNSSSPKCVLARFEFNF